MDKIITSYDYPPIPTIARGKVWCRTCGREKMVDPTESMRTGWAKCCGYTMTIDHPDTW